MKQNTGLVILHIDGLSYNRLHAALQQGRMPFVQRLLEDEAYQVQRYRCGIPSTTPYCQAGILYGDNSEIPSFRWWDKQAGIAVSFGGSSSFTHVAHKYFRDCVALTDGGASIATCYPNSLQRAYRVGYREHGHSLRGQAFSQKRVVMNWAMNPIHLLDWLRRGVWQLWKVNWQYWRARLAGQPAAKRYVIGDMLEEIILHHLTRFAVIQVMQENYPVIYGAFYAYDETAHAFGPDADYSFRILRHVDNSIRRIANWRNRTDANARAYELVILSDHGQVETLPFAQVYGQRFADVVAEWLPTFEIEEQKGKRIARKAAIDGHVILSYAGGLAHFYFKDISWRLAHSEIEQRFPGLIERAACTPGIEFVMTREGTRNILSRGGERIEFERGTLTADARAWLAAYDEPAIVTEQLNKLNSFERAGDLILFGKFADGKQINFENQVGGHGSLGGEQMFPFVVSKRAWQFDLTRVNDAADIHPVLNRLAAQVVSN